MTGTKRIQLALTGAIFAATTFASMAQATQPNGGHPQQKGDVFNRTTAPVPNAAANTYKRPAPPWVMPRVTPQSKPLEWMEAYDDAVGHYKVTVSEAVIMKKPLNQEVERVMEWSRTAAGIAKRYRLLAKTIRSMPPCNGMPESTVYMQNMADWYDDSAAVFEDMIRPRKAAKTQEELQASLEEIHTRVEGLRQQYRSLKMMDSKMRVTYNLHQPRHDDALLQYTTRDPNL